MLKNALPRSLVNDLNNLPRQNIAVAPICPSRCRGAQPLIADNLSVKCSTSSLRKLLHGLCLILRIYTRAPSSSHTSATYKQQVGLALDTSGGRPVKGCSIAFKGLR